MICLLLFSGCSTSSAGVDMALAVRQRFMRTDGCQFDCTVQADYGDYLFTFALLCKANRDGTIQFEVTKPDSVSGITGYIDSEGGNLTFDDQVLAFPPLADGYISPVIGPWLFIKALSTGYISYVDTSDGNTLVCFDDSFRQEPLQTRLWLDDMNIPVHCEFIWRNVCIVSLQINNYTYL